MKAFGRLLFGNWISGIWNYPNNLPSKGLLCLPQAYALFCVQDILCCPRNRFTGFELQCPESLSFPLRMVGALWWILSLSVCLGRLEKSCSPWAASVRWAPQNCKIFWFFISNSFHLTFQVLCANFLQAGDVKLHEKGEAWQRTAGKEDDDWEAQTV